MTPKQEKQLDEIHDAMIEIVPMVKEHRRTLYGNAQPGLTDRVLKLETLRKSGRGNVVLAIQVILCIVAVISVFINLRN